MGSDVSPDRLRALLIPDPRVQMDNVWSAGSTYTQSGLRAGVPTKVSAADSNLVLNATGTVHTGQAGKDLRIKCHKAGMPTTGSNAAGFIWKNDGDADYRGWDFPKTISDWEAIDWDYPASGFATGDFHSVTLADDSILVVYSRLSATGSMRVSKRSPTAGTWSTAVVASTGIKTANNPTPCLLLMPSGRVLCFSWFRDSGGYSANVRVHYSDDDGASWTLGTDRALPVGVVIGDVPGSGALGFDVGRLRAAYHNGSICLVSELKQHDTDPNYRDVFQQWASADLGASFTEVGNAWDGGSPDYGKYHEVLSVDDSIFLFYLRGADVRSRKIGSAFEAFETTSETDPGIQARSTITSTPGAEMSAGQLAICEGPHGVLYAVGMSPNNHMGTTVSFDRGITWEASSSGSDWGSDFYVPERGSGSITTGPANSTLTYQGGRLVVISNLTATAAIDESIVVLYLGGFSTVTMPQIFPGAGYGEMAGFDTTYLPFDVPTDMGWTKTSSGGATESVSGASLDLPDVGGTSTIYYENASITTTAPDITNGVILKTSLKVNAGSSTAQDYVAVKIRIADGTNDYDVSIRFATTGFMVRDNNAGSSVGATTVATTAGIEVLIAIAGNDLKSWYRAKSTTPDRQWTAGPASTSLTSDTGSPAATSRIVFGRIFTSATADAEWYSLMYLGFDSNLTGWDDSRLPVATFPDMLAARDYSTAPSTVTGGIDISAIDGPAFAGDEFSVQSRYQYEVSRAVVGSDDPPSPRVRWRSTDETEHTIAFGLTADPTTDEAYPFCDAIGVALLGINFKTAILQGYDVGTTAWVDLVAMDASSGMSALNWTRKGDTVRPTSGSSHTAEPFFDAAELVGGTFALDGDKRKIVANSGGAWSGSHSSRQITNVQVTLTGSEGASGSSGAIWAPQLAGTIPLLGATYSAYRIKIAAAQGAVEGYYEIGAIVIGPLFLFADSYAWGRSITTTANTELTEDRDWTTHSRVLGPDRRVVEFGWTDPVDEFAYGATSPNPDYIKTTTTAGSLPSGSKGATIRQMEGYLRQLDGADTPVVYFPEIVKSTLQADDDRVYNRRDQFVYGRIVSKVRRDTVMGTEGVDELVRLTKVTIQEEV